MNKKEFLTDEEAGLLVGRIKSAMGPVFSDLIDQYGGDIRQKDLLRFMPVSARCKAAREEKGFSIKDAALCLNVPQYCLKAVERESLTEIKQDILEQYIDFLGLRKWFDIWFRNNRAVYQRLRKEKGGTRRHGKKYKRRSLSSMR